MVLASQVEPLALDVVRALSIPPMIRQAVLIEVQRRLDHPLTDQKAQRGVLEAQLNRLRDIYQLGHIERSEYIEKRSQLEQQLARIPAPSARLLNVERAVTMLSDLATLLDTATPAQRRALVHQILDTIWIKKTPSRR
jgi:hypothetical protein